MQSKIVKYIITIGLIFVILKMVPQQHISNRDMILILAIIIFGLFIVDNSIFKKENFMVENVCAQTTNISKENLITNDILKENLINISQKKKIEHLSFEPEKQPEIQPSYSVLYKYFDFLIDDLQEKNILTPTDVENIKIKLSSKLLSLEEIILSLEVLRKEGKNKIIQKDDLPSEFYSPIGNKIANDWDNDFVVLNTNKWQVPMKRPPVCINTNPCPVCPDTTSTFTNLKQWDDSRYVSTAKPPQ